MLVLDSGAVTRLSERSRQAAGLIGVLQAELLWPPVVPSAVLVECLTGRSLDARTNQFLKSCRVATSLPVQMARRAAFLRAVTGRGSAIDAIVVAFAEPGGTVLTGDTGDLRALATHAADVFVQAI